MYIRRFIAAYMHGRKFSFVFWTGLVLLWLFFYVFWLTNYSDRLLSDAGANISPVNAGRHLYYDRVFSVGDVNEKGELLPTSRFPPIYPIFFFLSFSLFGDTPIALEAIRWMLFLMGIGMIYLTYRIGMLWSRRLGYIAAFLAAIDVHMLSVAMNYDASDFVVSFFLAVSIYFLMRYIRVRQTLSDLIFSALLFAAALLTKVTVYLLWVPLLILLIAYCISKNNFSRRSAVLHSMIFFGIILLFFGGWKIRNWYAVGTSSFTSQSGEVLLQYHAGYTLARALGKPELASALVDQFSEILPPDAGGLLSPSAKSDYFSATGKRILLKHPLTYLVVKIVDVPNLFLGTLPPYYFFPRVAMEKVLYKFSTGEVFGNRALLSYLWAEGFYLYIAIYVFLKMFMLGLLAAAVLGVFFMIRDRAHLWLLGILLIVISYIVFVSTPVATPRYRPPLMPALYVLSAYSILSLGSTVRRLMNTRRKMMIARLVFLPISFARRLVGKSDHAHVRRNGFVWHLDLSEGIELVIYLLGAFERDTMRAYHRILRPGDSVLDIGAHIGAHTLPMAKCVIPYGRIFAIEPTVSAFSKLVRNINANADIRDSVTPLQIELIGLGQAPSAVQNGMLFSSWPLKKMKGRHPVHGGNLQSTQGAKRMTIDALLEQWHIAKIDFVKMDIDGMECAVLSGARQLLQVHRPVFIMELLPYGLQEHGASLEELVAIFRAHRYSFFDLHDQKLPSDVVALLKTIPVGGSRNVIARPLTS